MRLLFRKSLATISPLDQLPVAPSLLKRGKESHETGDVTPSLIKRGLGGVELKSGLRGVNLV